MLFTTIQQLFKLNLQRQTDAPSKLFLHVPNLKGSLYVNTDAVFVCLLLSNKIIA